ncbi:MAG TPA: phosphoribosylformylglycinamidine synthase subunit PurL [Candidatus Thermoplasmatota archaeon]|nr:phosphoribosylformylglycinamidine synthase subunit PurL [Candidatus Thermoplasmatota archaeon]
MALDKYLRLVRADPPVYEVDLLHASDEGLLEISAETRIGLSLDEMKVVRDHFKAKGRNPRDVELESLGQAWSEHCCYKSSKPVLKRHVYGIHEDKLVCREDAGVAPFDDKHHYVVKIESHNHPSAIEPYGGAATGIGGVLRDVVCMGAEPIGLIDPLFFGPLDTPREALPPGTRSPRYLFGGVVAGIRDYGNRVGIPTVAGMIHFHPKFITNNLVNVGCVGIMPKEHLIHSRVGGVGDVFILLGGRTGRDGIHGVTFASADLAEDAEETSRSAVQLGDPITKEPLIHAVLEANAKGILTGMKDLGGGGLSCVCGEMALDAGLGVVVNLDKVHLKEPGMKPWEVWVSESQERMMVTVRPSNVQKVLDVARKWDVEAVVVAEAIREKVVRVLWKGEPVLEMESEFLYGGPVYNRPMEKPATVDVDEKARPRKDWSKTLKDLLASENICSRELVIRMYDHEVKANTVIKPLQGKVGVASHGDATVLKPVASSWRGLALTTDVNPNFTDIDPYWGAASAFDEVVRNLAAVGARLDSVADNLNLANPQRPNRMWETEEATRGLGDAARALGVPFISGNVSMYNESPTTPIPPTPTLLGAGLVKDIRKCVTTDLKKKGAKLYLVGVTRDEMGGSEFNRLLGLKSNRVPRVDFRVTKVWSEALVTAIEKGLVAAAHDVSAGGLAVAVSEMAFGGDLGATVKIPEDVRADVALFSESNTRWVVEAKDPKKLEAHFRKAGAPLALLGAVGGRDLVFKQGRSTVAKLALVDARRAWTEALPRLVGSLSPAPPAVAPKARRAAKAKRAAKPAARRSKGGRKR